MKCTNCGTENPDGFKFCGTCGTPQSATAHLALPRPHPASSSLIIGNIVIPQNTILLLFVLVFALCLSLSLINGFAREFGKSMGLVYASMQTSKPIASITLPQIQACCQKMAASQRDQYLESLVGKRVNWQATVSSVRHNGTVNLLVGDTSVELKGVPSDVAANLQEKQSIEFIAVITKAEEAIAQPGVELVYESLQ